MCPCVFARVVACAGLAVAGHSPVVKADDAAPLLPRDPSVSKSEIAFGYAGDIWTANRDGSSLRRLTTTGHESKPAFSPDGSQIAFVSECDGARAVYVVPASGGEPRRLTFHPADLGPGGLGSIPDFVGWTPDGKRILFNSRRAAFDVWSFGIVQLFTIAVQGGFATPVPLARAAQGSLSPDGTRIAYVPNAQRQLDWKGYRGGNAKRIWIADLADSALQRTIPRNNSNDFNPMWVGDTLYFLSDRDGPVTLFAYDLISQQVKEVVHNRGFDIKSAAATSDAIIYEQFGSLHLLDLKSGDDRALNLRPQAGFAESRPRFETITPAQLRFAGISPSGEHALFGAHGEILTVSAEMGDIRNLTRTTDVVERDPAWSPDGNSIAYFSDDSGEYELHIRDPRGLGDVRKINLGNPPSFFYSPTWAPNSQKIAYTDKRLNYWYVDLHKNVPVKVDTDLYVDPKNRLQLAWSPDSRWIAYTKQLPSHLHAVFVYSLEQAKRYQLTDGMSDALHVAFDKSGRYLYFTASTTIALSTSQWDMTAMQHPVTRNVYFVMLKAGLSSPLAPPSDEEKIEPTGQVPEDSEKGEHTNRVDIDLGGIGRRIESLPIPARNYYDLVAGKAGSLFLVERPQVDLIPHANVGQVDNTATIVYRFDLSTGKTCTILHDVVAFSGEGEFEEVSSFHLSFSGEKMLYAQRNQSKQIHWFIAPIETAAPPQDFSSSTIDLDNVAIYVDPRAEWKHMFVQVWRDERDFFYDPHMHGIDLESIMKKYAPFLENLSTRDDLNYLFNEMLGNLTVGHLRASEGDSPRSTLGQAGLLGADYTIANGRYRFAHIYNGDTWNPAIQAPLTRPGVNVQVGAYLLAVDGRDVRPTADIYRFFEGTAGKAVVLTIGPRADGTGARRVTVVPIEDETSLRNFAWIDNNRRKVDELSGGRVAYVYLPDTYERGYASFNRDYFAQVGKEGAIIDVRYNSGGDLGDYIIDCLRRPLLNYWHTREGRDMTSPQEAIFGPKVMIINGLTGSGGEHLAWMFRQAAIGPLIGERTWGGLVGTYANPGDLLDGGYVATPNLAFYNPNGTWDIENHGVAPDIEVPDDPKAIREGHDSQLEKAVEVVLELLKKAPSPSPSRHPPYPTVSHQLHLSHPE